MQIRNDKSGYVYDELGREIRHYPGKQKIKAEGVEIEFTKKELKELKKCKKDPIYFIRNYVYIVTLDKGFAKFSMYDYQEKLVNLVHNNRKVVANLCRQAGKTSTISAGYFLYYILFNSFKTTGILANKAETANGILGRLKKSYEALPYWMQNGVVKWNETSIELENGSIAFASATSDDAGRSYSINALLLDEVAHIDSKKWEAFYTSVYPTISSGESTKIICLSTPKGYNHFYKLYNDAENGKNGFKPYSVTWRDVPGRDEKWAEETKSDIGEKKFAQEYDIEFLGSSNTLINANAIRNMSESEPIFQKKDLYIYENPKKDHTYIITVDVGQGKDQDNSAFSVIDITDYPFKQVAAFYTNKVSPTFYPYIISKTGNYYNDAYILVENNDKGGEVLNILNEDIEYEHILSPGTGPGTGKKFELGIRTGKAVKRVGCNTLKDLIEGEKLLIQDYNTIIEITGFIENGKGSYEADSGFNDDLVMGLVIFSWLTTRNYFEDLTDYNVRKKLAEEKMENLEENVAPLPIFYDGIDDNEETWETELIWHTYDSRLF